MNTPLSPIVLRPSAVSDVQSQVDAAPFAPSSRAALEYRHSPRILPYEIKFVRGEVRVDEIATGNGTLHAREALRVPADMRLEVCAGGEALRILGKDARPYGGACDAYLSVQSATDRGSSAARPMWILTRVFRNEYGTSTLVFGGPAGNSAQKLLEAIPTLQYGADAKANRFLPPPAR